MRKSIGIDVSKTKLDVSIFDGDEHRQISSGNTESGLKELLGRMGRLQGQELVITMEATGTYHLRAAMGLHEAGYTVSVVNPLIIKRYSEMKMLRAKTDPVDARLIAELNDEMFAHGFGCLLVDFQARGAGGDRAIANESDKSPFLRKGRQADIVAIHRDFQPHLAVIPTEMLAKERTEIE